MVITDRDGPGALQTERLHALLDVYRAPRPGPSGPVFYVKTAAALRELADNFSPLKGEYAQLVLLMDAYCTLAARRGHVLRDNNEYGEGHIVRYGRGSKIWQFDPSDLPKYLQSLTMAHIPVNQLPDGGFRGEIIWESQDFQANCPVSEIAL